MIEKALNEVHIARSAVAILHARVSDYPAVTAPPSSTLLAANEDSDYGSPDWAEVVKLFQIAREFLESRKKGSSRLFRILDVGRLPEFESEIKIKGHEYLEQNCADGAKFQFAIFELPKQNRLVTRREYFSNKEIRKSQSRELLREEINVRRRERTRLINHSAIVSRLK